eukprot:SM006539S20384  [mRNA]  locus=s6539:715:813:- [translate_table: standard]
MRLRLPASKVGVACARRNCGLPGPRAVSLHSR